jgi:hypothetical protein
MTTSSTQHTEGPVARAIEEQTAKLPSDTFLWAAGASIAGSLILKMLDRHHEALYNKLVKQRGSDQFDN